MISTKQRPTRGFFGIGIYHTKAEVNIGTLWRSADIFGAAFVFTVGRRYRTQASDVLKSTRHVPLYHYTDIDDLVAHLPDNCRLVGVEMDTKAQMVADYNHPERACYLLGAEDHGLSAEALRRCHSLVKLPGRLSLNVAVAGSIVLHDRVAKSREVPPC